MKRIILLMLIICPFLISAQNTKKEERQKRKAERAEMYRRADSLLNADKEKERIAVHKLDATSIIVTTSYQTSEEVFDILIRQMIQRGDIPQEKDKDYFIIKTKQKQVFHACYDITYAVYQQNGKVKVRANATAYGSFSVGSGIIRSQTDMVVPVKYRGKEGSLFITAWKEIEEYMLSLPLIESVEYIKDES